ncbi:MAG: transglutaminase-like putative cysteine protease [Kiritimatiellia bacterium]|jgi:transglutaminase-like putative cysteine protease
MTRRTLSRISAAAVAMAGLIGLSTLGMGWICLCTMILCLLAPALRHRLPALPWGVITVVGLAVGTSITFALSFGLVQTAGMALIVLLTLRSWSRAGPTDDRIVVLITLLMLVLSAARSTSPVMLGAFVMWAAAAPITALLSHLQASSRSSAFSRVVPSHLGWLSLATLGLSIVVFLAVPRLRPADLGGATTSTDRHIGFADHVELGDLGRLLDSPNVVLRVTPLTANATDRLYIRGTTLDRYDGKAWQAAAPAGRPTHQGPTLTYRVLHEANAGQVVFSPGTAVRVDIDRPGAAPDRDGNWRLRGTPRRLTYLVHVPSTPQHTVATDEDLLRWTGLPPDLDPRLASTAKELTEHTNSRIAAAQSVQRWLLSEFDYSYAPRDESLEAPLEHFLYERRTGHCEYFAASMAVLLRTRGIPTRIVNGYTAADWNEAGGYWIVRQGHAHSWVEVLDQQGRWVRFDPTPGGSRPPPATSVWASLVDTLDTTWHQGVLGYDWSVQTGLIRTAGWRMQTLILGPTTQAGTPWLGVVLIVGPLTGVFLIGSVALRSIGRRLADERPGRPSGRVARYHARARRHLHRMGWHVPESLPPVAAAAWLRDRCEDAGQDLQELAWLHYRVRYGREDDVTLAPDARVIARRLYKSLPRSPTTDHSRYVPPLPR